MNFAMKKIAPTILSWLLLAGLTSACSTQNREATPLVSEQELRQIYEDLAVNSGDATISAMSYETLATERSTVLYHTGHSGATVGSGVVSIADMNVFDSSLDIGFSSTDLGIDLADVIFVDSIDAEGSRTFSLMMGLQAGEGYSLYFAASSDPDDYVFTDDSFETVLTGPEGQRLVVRSTDVSDKYNDVLADSIKLSIYIEEDGGLYYVGQISTMAGFVLQ